MLPIHKALRSAAAVHWMLALPCEAKPLVKAWRLSRLMHETVFPIYRNDSMTLTVTGVGKTAMAAGVAYTGAVCGGTRPSIWLNLGIAGHPQSALGELFLAHKITDRERDRNWFPPLIAKPPCLTESLITCSRPDTDYAQSALYDMEGSAFFETASRFSSTELIQCLKVISDNRLNPAVALDPKAVSELIEGRIDLINRVVEQLQNLAKLLPSGPQSERFEQFIIRWRFTAQQASQLDSLLHRWMLLDPARCPVPEQLGHLKQAEAVLAFFRERIDDSALAFP
ncbi:MAG: hypothetical protein ACU843_00715 [Gammaproteobacteria bacterium]